MRSRIHHKANTSCQVTADQAAAWTLPSLLLHAHPKGNVPWQIYTLV
jgi:hypothetical protein